MASTERVDGEPVQRERAAQSRASTARCRRRASPSRLFGVGCSGWPSSSACSAVEEGQVGAASAGACPRSLMKAAVRRTESATRATRSAPSPSAAARPPGIAGRPGRASVVPAVARVRLAGEQGRDDDGVGRRGLLGGVRQAGQAEAVPAGRGPVEDGDQQGGAAGGERDPEDAVGGAGRSFSRTQQRSRFSTAAAWAAVCGSGWSRRSTVDWGEVVKVAPGDEGGRARWGDATARPDGPLTNAPGHRLGQGLGPCRPAVRRRAPRQPLSLQPRAHRRVTGCLKIPAVTEQLPFRRKSPTANAYRVVASHPVVRPAFELGVGSP